MQRLFFSFMFALTSSLSAGANSNLCLKAIQEIAGHKGISPQLLLKIARAESGYGQLNQPWPWTINVKGKDYYFKNQQGAVAYIERLIKSGIQSFDVGCFQINWRWHRTKVSSPAELLHPTRNALIAADYLQELYVQHRSVSRAVAHYHSSNPYRGAQYVKHVFAK